MCARFSCEGECCRPPAILNAQLTRGHAWKRYQRGKKFRYLMFNTGHGVHYVNLYENAKSRDFARRKFARHGVHIVSMGAVTFK